MKTNNKFLVSWIAVWILALITISWVSAYKWDPSVQWPNYSTERHNAMEQAFETNNYEAWLNLMDGRGRVTQVITADNFARFAEAHELAENGDIAWATEIRNELGLGLNNGNNKGIWKGNNRGNWKWAWMGNCSR